MNNPVYKKVEIEVVGSRQPKTLKADKSENIGPGKRTQLPL